MKVATLTSLMVLCFVSNANADSLTATLGQPLREVSHTVDVSFSDGLVTFEVERAFYNGGTRADEVQLFVDLPPGAVATGLRIKGPEQWYEGELLPREEAARRYEELTGMGAYQLKDPALLSWISPSSLSLQVFPVKPGETNRVAYTLVAPADYVDGRYLAHYPERGAAMASVTLRLAKGAKVVHDVELDEELDGCGPDTTTNTFASISVAPPHIPIVASRYGRFALSATRDVWRFEADAAPHIGEVPRNAHVVLLLDGSKSQGQAGVEAEAALARAYLSHFPAETLVEVVWYARTPVREHGKFVSVAAAKARLAAIQAHPLATRNGSDIVAGLAETAKILSNVSGARRVLLMTDGLLAEGYDNAAAIAALMAAHPDRPDADLVLHIVERDRGDLDEEPQETRDDEDALAPVAAAFGGMFGIVTGMGKAAELAAIALPYARPVRIDGLDVTAFGLGIDVGETFEEGTALRFAGVDEAIPETIVMTGKIWGRDWKKVVAPNDAYRFRAAALVFGDDTYAELSDEDQTKVASVGVVSPVTSYLAIEPGVRPSTEGIEERAISGFGCIGGVGVGDAIGCIGVGHVSGDPNETVLQKAVEEANVACRVNAVVATDIVVEVKLDEVVDIVPAIASPFATCVAERLWTVDLPSDFVSRTHTLHAL